MSKQDSIPVHASASPRESDESTKLNHINRVLGALRAGHRALVDARNEDALLGDICRVIVEKGGFLMAWVGYADHDEQQTIRPVAYAGREDGFFAATTFSWGDNERGRGAAGTAIRSGRPSIGRQLRSDPALSPWREEALKRGYGASSAFPLCDEDEVFGCLVIVAAEDSQWNEGDVEWLGELAEGLAYGINHLRIQKRHVEAERVIERMAHYDELTGLPNRATLAGQLADAIVMARDKHYPLSVLSIAVGHYNEISDTLGHRTGDRFLVEIAERICGNRRGKDEVLARVGEDEFALLLLQAGADRATTVAQRIITALYEPVDLAGLLLDARAAIGIALFPGHGSDPDELMRRANVAMCRARHVSGSVALYSGLLDEERSRRLTLMGDLRGAIDHNELMLYCQPKVQMMSRRLCGAEALVRWRHAEQGMIAPGEFVKLAEHAGLITPLTLWMLEAAFSQRYAWHEAGFEQALAINLSMHDLLDPKLLDRIRGLFATWGTHPDWIQFEITESALMEEPDGVIATLGQLKDLGVKLLVDDFGTGYSSLSYLQRMPVDSIKIDQSFVRHMTVDEDSATIVRSTIELSHSLNMQVIAEGVEDEDVWQALSTLGCDICQGYYVGRPLPAIAFKNWAEKSPWQH